MTNYREILRLTVMGLSQRDILRMNITVTKYRQSGEMETAVPVFRKTAFRKNGNHYGC